MQGLPQQAARSYELQRKCKKEKMGRRVVVKIHPRSKYFDENLLNWEPVDGVDSANATMFFTPSPPSSSVVLDRKECS